MTQLYKFYSPFHLNEYLTKKKKKAGREICNARESRNARARLERQVIMTHTDTRRKASLAYLIIS